MDALIRQYEGCENGRRPNGCRGGIDFFFVDARDGNAYPCGYRGNENMGKLWEMDVAGLKERVDTEACVRCDWECFRDPTEIMTPVLQLLNSPLRLLKQLLKRDPALGLWLQDILYYRACDFFDGRRPPDYARLSSYKNLTFSGRKQT